jgi:hypothetical protein
MNQSRISYSLFYQECNGLKMYTLSEFTDRGTRNCRDKTLAELGSFVKVGTTKAHSVPELTHNRLSQYLEMTTPVRSTRSSKKWDIDRDMLPDLLGIMKQPINC